MSDSLAAEAPTPSARAHERLTAVDVRSIYAVKAVAFAALVILGQITDRFALLVGPAARASEAMLLALATSLVVVGWPGTVPSSVLSAGFALDILAITAATFAGGATEMLVGPVAYVASVGLAGLVLAERAALAVAAASSLAYAAMVALAYAGWLGPYPVPPRPPIYQLQVVITVGIVLFASAAVVSYAMRQLRLVHQQADAMRAAAVVRLSRDLKQPLAILRDSGRRLGVASAAERATLVPQIQHWVRLAIDRVHNVLEAAGLLRRPLAAQRAPVPLGALLETLVDSYQPTAALYGVPVTLHVGPDAPPWPIDARLVERAVGNLLANAITHGRGGAVTVRLDYSAATATIAVIDAGPGLAADAIDRNEESGANPVLTNRGLGLYLARHIAVAHGGALHVESGSAGGTTVRLVLPQEPPAQTVAVARSTPLRWLLGQALPRQNLRAVFAGKSLALLIFAIAAWVIGRTVLPDAPAGPLIALIVIDLVPSLAVVAWPRQAPVELLALSLLADLVALTLAIHVAGGVESIAGPIVYAVLIGLVGLMLSERAALAALAAAVVLYSSLVWAEWAAVLPHRVPFWRPPRRQAAAVLFVALALSIFTWVVLSAIRRIRQVYEQAEMRRTEAVSALAHDLKNPLAVILGYGELLALGDEVPFGDLPRRIELAAQRALALVDNALDAAAVEGRELSPQLAPLAPGTLLAEIAELYESAAASKAIDLVQHCAPDLPTIAADASLLPRAIGNLVSNGIKYTERGGRVELTATARDGVVTFRVSDSGRGMAPEEVARLFQPYSRVSSARGVEGTGLGLYIVRRIAEVHGGAVEVTSTQGAGSQFAITVPAIAAPSAT